MDPRGKITQERKVLGEQSPWYICKEKVERKKKMEEFQKITFQTWIYILVNTEEMIFTLAKGQQAANSGSECKQF